MVETLSPQELKVLELAAKGHTDKGIADALNISPTTVVTYWQRIRAKMGLHSRPELVASYAMAKADAEVAALKAELMRHLTVEDELLKSLERFRVLIDAAPEAVVVVRPDGVIISGNQRAAEVLECERSEFSGIRIGTFIPPEIHDLHRQWREQYMQDPARLAMGHDRGVEVITKTGRRLKAIVTINVAKVDQEEAVVTIIRPLNPSEG